MPVKCLEGFNRATPVSGPTFVDATVGGKRLRRGARLWSVATATFKIETYRFRRLERPEEDQPDPPGTIHLPDWADSEWLKQLVAEQLVTVRNKRGYARAAAWIMGADRWDKRMWRQFEDQAGVATRADAPDTDAAEPATDPPARQAGAPPTTPRRKRQTYTPRFMR